MSSSTIDSEIMKKDNETKETKQSDTEIFPRKLTAEQVKQRRIAARQRVVEEYSRCKRHIELVEKRILEVEGWLELDKTSVKQKQYQLYKLEHQVTELKRKHAQLQRAVDYIP